MINAKDFLQRLKNNNLNYFSGVPDSTFKEFISEIALDSEVQHRIASNECEAISLSSGYHLATGEIGVTYMQNSGFGKIINPLTSLLSKEVYSIPTLLFIGYRGKPGKKDEPQHKMMGRLTVPLLEVLEIPYKIMPKDIEKADKLIFNMKKLAEKTKYTVAIIIEKGTFEGGEIGGIEQGLKLTREEAIKEIVKSLPKNSTIISTTGKTSRELFECRMSNNQNATDFLMVGSMGCASAIAAEIAIQKSDKNIYCFDGDGAAIMQMGTFLTIGTIFPKNFRHILFDNNSYDSTGGQRTVSSHVNFEKIASACGYSHTNTISNRKELNKELNKIRNVNGPTLTIIKIKRGARKNLGRPTITPIQNKETFVSNLI